MRNFTIATIIFLIVFSFSVFAADDYCSVTKANTAETKKLVNAVNKNTAETKRLVNAVNKKERKTEEVQPREKMNVSFGLSAGMDSPFYNSAIDSFEFIFKFGGMVRFMWNQPHLGLEIGLNGGFWKSTSFHATPYNWGANAFLVWESKYFSLLGGIDLSILQHPQVGGEDFLLLYYSLNTDINITSKLRIMVGVSVANHDKKDCTGPRPLYGLRAWLRYFF